MRQRLSSDETPVPGCRLDHVLGAEDPQVDSVRDVETRVLPEPLDAVHELPREAFCHKLVGQTGIQRRRVAGFALHDQVTAGLLHHLEISGFQGMALTFQIDDDGLPAPERLEGFRREGANRGRSHVRVLAEPGSKGAEVGARRQLHQLIRRAQELHRLDVELVLQELQQLGPNVSPRQHTEEAGQGLTDP